MDTGALSKMWWVWGLVALAVGLGGGYWYGQQAGVALEKARQEAATRQAEEKAAKEANPFLETTANPFEKNPANPYENVKVNPFE
jgi:uncharacterized protein HemX